MKITINSDDPVYFDGYVNDNYRQLVSALDLSDQDINQLVQNSLEARFIK